MTVAPVVTETVVQLTGGTLGPFATGWPYEQPGDVLVRLDSGTGLFTTLGLGSDYLLAATDPLDVGGQVTLSATLLPSTGVWASGAQLAMVRDTSDDQPSSFGDTTDFDPATSEGALDHVQRQLQELDAGLARALVLRPGEAGYEYPAASDRANLVMAFDATGRPVAIAPPENIGLAAFDLSNVPYAEPYAGAVSRLILLKLNEFDVSPTDFGAIPDGRNCDAAMQAAIATGRNVFCPPGTYGVTQPWKLNSGQRIRGVRLGTLFMISTTVPGDFIIFPADIGTYAFECGIEDMRLDATGMIDGHVIQTISSHYPSVRRVSIINAPGIWYTANSFVPLMERLFAQATRGTAIQSNGLPYMFFMEGRTSTGNEFLIRDSQINASGTLRPSFCIGDGNCATLDVARLGVLSPRDLFHLRNTTNNIAQPAYWRVDKAGTDFQTGHFAKIEAATDCQFTGMYAHGDGTMAAVDALVLDDYQGMTLPLTASGSAASNVLTGLSPLTLISSGMNAFTIAGIVNTSKVLAGGVNTAANTVTLDTPSTVSNPSAYVDFTATIAGCTVAVGSTNVGIPAGALGLQQGQDFWGPGIASGSKVATTPAAGATSVTLTKPALVSSPTGGVTCTYAATLICKITAGSPVLSNFVGVELLSVPMIVIGVNIPAGTTISGILGPNSISLSQNPSGPVSAVTIKGVATRAIQNTGFNGSRLKGYGKSGLRNETGYSTTIQMNIEGCSRYVVGQWPAAVVGPFSVGTNLGLGKYGKDQQLNPFMSYGLEVQTGAQRVLSLADLTDNLTANFIDQTGQLVHLP